MAKSLERRQTSVEQQMRALRQRVTYLERALKPARTRSAKAELNAKREIAEDQGRRDALKEYYKQAQIENYLKNPWLLEATMRIEKKQADFLKARGFKPEPSSIPEQFRRGLKKYRPKAEPK
jgi:hypothetical protein